MKKTNIFYWIFTIIFGGFMFMSAIPDIVNDPEAVKFMTQLGYPDYFTPFIGVLKVLGVIALFIPGFPRVTEWAYAGLFFDLIGATYSMAMAASAGRMLNPDGTPASPAGSAIMLVFIGLGIASYVFYHRRLAMKRLSPAIA